jgi:outer membrane protein OmpA-like peptidoglycan-associated protein
MQKTSLLAGSLLVATLALPAGGQRPGAVEAGLFGQFTKLDEELSLDDVISIGARLGLFVLPNLAFEVDGHIGKTDWLSPSGTKSITYSPFAVRGVYGLPLGDRLRLLVGAGYQQNVYRDRIIVYQNAIAGNEYEDAFSGLVGLKVCLTDKWSLRGDVPIDFNPSPNFNGSLVTLDGKSTNIGFRIGVSRMFRGDCYQAAPAAPPPPPAAAPAPPPQTPPQPPQPTPTPVPAPNRPPVATITSPANGASLTGPTNFAGSCQDPEQGNVTSSGRWRSSRDGDIGTGGSFTRTLTPGNHTVTLTCSDTPGLTGSASINVTSQELLVRLNWVYFDFDQSTLTAAGRDSLDRVIATLQQRTDIRIAVEGHTDPYGSDSYNAALSDRRVQTVVGYLANGGVAPSRMQSKGFGEQCLVLDDNHDSPVRSKPEHGLNRRVEIWSVGDGGVAISCRPRQ